MHELLYAMADSNQCQLADPQHVEAISGNARQMFEDQLYKFCGAQLRKQTADVIIKQKKINEIRRYAIETIFSQRIRAGRTL